MALLLRRRRLLVLHLLLVIVIIPYERCTNGRSNDENSLPEAGTAGNPGEGSPGEADRHLGEGNCI